MNKNYKVIRKGKCIECGNLGGQYIGEFEAESKEEAINKAIESWNYENFGQGGALREHEVVKEESFLEGDFVAKEIN